jgi:DNA-binding LacI/PurR family transcriptional regulator
VTLKHVAEEAGVSIQTASHVLSGNMKVRLPDSTRERVKEAAEKVGYQPNRHAQAMRSGKTNVISVWMPIDRLNLSYLHFLQQISRRALASGYEIMIAGLDRNTALLPNGPSPTNWPVDGVISMDAGKAVEAYRKNRANDHVPVCVLGFELASNGDAVGWNLHESYKQLTQKMIAEGRRNIVHVTTDWVLADFPREQRRRGYTEAMEEAGLKPRFVAVSDETTAAAYDAARDFLSRFPETDGLACMTDTLAVGAGRAALELGRTIPEEIVLWGLGNYPVGEEFAVPVTTLEIPFATVVDRAWTWLIERIQCPELEPRETVVPMNIIERASTGN